LYESFFEKQENSLSADSIADEEIEVDPVIKPPTGNEGGVEAPLTEVPQDSAEKRSFMERIRQSSFEHEVRHMPKVSEKDVKGEYNFFQMFEASARNVPQESVNIFWGVKFELLNRIVIQMQVLKKELVPRIFIPRENWLESICLKDLMWILYSLSFISKR